MPILNDTFTGTNGTLLSAHTPETGTWTGADSTLEIQSNALTSKSPYGTPALAQVVEDPSGADVTGTMIIAATDKYKNHAMRFRWDVGGGAYYQIGYQYDALTMLIINPATSRADSLSNTGITTQTPGTHTVRVDITGSGAAVTIVVRIDGVIEWTYTDNFTGRIVDPGKFGVAITSDAGNATNAVLNSVNFDNANPNLSVGTPHFVSATDSEINLHSPNPEGGTGDYQSRWHRSENPYFTPDAGTRISSLGDNQDYTDATAAAGVVCFYKCEIFDGTDTVYSGKVAGALWLAPLKTVAFLGDSITGGYVGEAGDENLWPLYDSAGDAYARIYGKRLAQWVGHGVGGSTTVDWQPGDANMDAFEATLTGDVTHVHVCLGTNDALSIDAGDYATNLGNIVAHLRDNLGRKVILSYPTGTDPSKAGYDVAKYNRIIAYQAEIDALVDDTNVFLGEIEMWSLCLQDSTKIDSDPTDPKENLWVPGGDLVHITRTGVRNHYAPLVARAIDRVLNPGGGGSAFDITIHGEAA